MISNFTWSIKTIILFISTRCLFIYTAVKKILFSLWNALKIPNASLRFLLLALFFKNLMFTQWIFYYITFYIYSWSFKICQQFSFLNWVAVYSYKSLRIHPHYIRVPGSVHCSTRWCDALKLYNLKCFLYGKSYKKMDKNSQETLFQSNFLWKECLHQSDNRTHMGKCSIRSTRNWGVFRAAHRGRWKISRGWKGKSHSHSIELSLILTHLLLSGSINLFFKNFISFILWEVILLNSMHALIQNA